MSVDPDQFYLGGHYETGPLVDRLHFKPNLEARLRRRPHALRHQLRVRLQVSRASGAWTLYAGGGPAINFYSFDDLDDSETEPGFNVLFGAEARSGLFFEMKIGAIDSPDLKFGVGWTFTVGTRIATRD